MCVVSMIVDHYRDKWAPWPTVPVTPTVSPVWPDLTKIRPKPITDEEINEFRELLRKAREYDKRTSQPDCEDVDKIAELRKALAARGIDLDKILA